MKKAFTKSIAVLTAAVMVTGSAVPTMAASTNKAAEIPVNFTNTSWEDDWETTSNSNADFWDLADGVSAYSDDYTVSFKLYVPASFFAKEDTHINIGGCVNVEQADTDEWKWAGWREYPGFELHDGQTLTVWDDEQQKDVPVDYATVKKTGDFYVISYEAPLKSELLPGDGSAEGTVSAGIMSHLTFNIAVKGIFINAKNSAVYLDDVKITAADGTVVANEDFSKAKKVEGEVRIAPNNGDNDGKQMKVATITDNKVLTVKSTKATVKVGKTVKIKATATPATKITYKSSNKKVAAVNAKGVVTGKKAGKATISVKANGKTVKVKVTVKK